MPQDTREALEESLAAGGPSLDRIAETLRQYGYQISQAICPLCHGTGKRAPSYVTLTDPCPCQKPL